MEQKKPNILWICTDQQRFDTLGCYGNQFVSTPNIDGLARGGAIFENAFSQSPVCSPSRGCFLTGRYPSTCRMRQNGADIPDTEELVTKIFRDNGYICGLSGKLHIRACNPKSGCTEIESRIDDGYSEFHWSHDTGSVWGLNNEYYRWLHDEFGDTYRTSSAWGSRFVNIGMPEERHQTTWCAEKAIGFIKANKSRPWLFSVNTYDPHHPFDPPEDLLRKYLDKLDSIPLPNYWQGEEMTKTVWQRQDHSGAYNHNAGFAYDDLSDNDHRMVRAAYWAMCDLIDRQVGRMLEALRETGQLDNTIIVFHSDHGEMLGDHGIYLKGPYFYDPAVKVPLIINWPGHVKPSRIPGLVELMDLPETLLDLAGIPRGKGMQGISLLPMLEDPSLELHEDAYSEYLNAMPWHKEPKAFASMVRTKNWKIVVSHAGDGGGELYDLAEDPGERRNLFHDKAAAEAKAEMTSRLLARWAMMPDPLPIRKSDW